MRQLDDFLEKIYIFNDTNSKKFVFTCVKHEMIGDRVMFLFVSQGKTRWTGEKIEKARNQETSCNDRERTFGSFRAISGNKRVFSAYQCVLKRREQCRSRCQKRYDILMWRHDMTMMSFVGSNEQN